MPNKSLLRKTLSVIKKNPKHWDQSFWHCGTSFCFAGWAVKLDGGRFPKNDRDYVLARDDDPEEDVIERYGDNGRKYRVVEIEARAHRILGLNYQRYAIGVHRLFAPQNTMADLTREVKKLTK
jgi:hypothetical protein